MRLNNKMRSNMRSKMRSKMRSNETRRMIKIINNMTILRIRKKRDLKRTHIKNSKSNLPKLDCNVWNIWFKIRWWIIWTLTTLTTLTTLCNIHMHTTCRHLIYNRIVWWILHNSMANVMDFRDLIHSHIIHMHRHRHMLRQMLRHIIYLIRIIKFKMRWHLYKTIPVGVLTSTSIYADLFRITITRITFLIRKFTT